MPVSRETAPIAAGVVLAGLALYPFRKDDGTPDALPIMLIRVRRVAADGDGGVRDSGFVLAVHQEELRYHLIGLT